MSEPAPELEKGNAGVRVPPPLIYLGFFIAALAVDVAFAGPGFASIGLSANARIGLGVVLFLVGMAVGAAGVSKFRSAGTEVRPWMPSTVLVATGVYRFTRNPMYLGMALAYAGLSFLGDSIIALACLIPLLVVVTYAVIKREERYLEVTFGEPYRAYKRRVRRWV